MKTISKASLVKQAQEHRHFDADEQYFTGIFNYTNGKEDLTQMYPHRDYSIALDRYLKDVADKAGHLAMLDARKYDSVMFIYCVVSKKIAHMQRISNY